MLTLPADEMNAFDLPPVCVVTGGTKDVAFKPVRFLWYPPWTRVLFVLAPPVGAVAALFATRRAVGELPFTEAGYGRWRTARILFVLSGLLAAAFAVRGVVLVAAGVRSMTLTVPWVPAFKLALPWFALAGALPLVTYLATRPLSVRVGWIRDGWLALRLPSGEAAQRIREHVDAGLLQAARHPALTDGAPCARHAREAAISTCRRCGAFTCARCEHRSRPEALPLCPACWELRGRHALALQPKVPSVLQTIGLVLGLWCLFTPCGVLSPVLVLSLVLNFAALIRALRGVNPEPYGRSVTGIAFSIAGFAMWSALFKS